MRNCTCLSKGWAQRWPAYQPVSILLGRALTHNCSSWRLLCIRDLTPGTLLHKVKRNPEEDDNKKQQELVKGKSTQYLVTIKWPMNWGRRPGHKWWPEVYMGSW